MTRPPPTNWLHRDEGEYDDMLEAVALRLQREDATTTRGQVSRARVRFRFGGDASRYWELSFTCSSSTWLFLVPMSVLAGLWVTCFVAVQHMVAAHALAYNLLLVVLIIGHLKLETRRLLARDE